jgi:hypothetical protein
MINGQPNPCTLEAQRKGCTCDPVANHNGIGFRGMVGAYVIEPGCPVHSYVTKATPYARKTTGPTRQGGDKRVFYKELQHAIDEMDGWKLKP